ncbi:MAG: ThiF family adenylyltransferase [Clostridiales bacterium]|nr:ThiF family adenylyltransferase [Clostridiales bacterium]
MINNIKLRMTGQQRSDLHSELKSKKNEVIIISCGVGECIDMTSRNYSLSIAKHLSIDMFENLSVSENDESLIYKITNKICKTEQIPLILVTNPLIYENDEPLVELLKISAKNHSHKLIGAYAILTSDNIIKGKVLFEDGEVNNIALTVTVDGDISFNFHDNHTSLELPTYTARNTQTFGKATTDLLAKLTIGIVGASGTGSPTIEMLYRLGVGKLVLCDSDHIEDVNLNRIYNSTLEDAAANRLKVDVISAAIKNSGLSTEVDTLPYDCITAKVMNKLSQCDILFGCVDSVSARDFLNRLSVYYTIPYFDMGVKLVADGNGGVEYVCGTIHYMKPDGPSLLTRGVFTVDQLSAESMKKNNPDEYNKQIKEKYIEGANETSPAVISVNTLVSSFGINDFLARIHPYRNNDNNDILATRINLVETLLMHDDQFGECHVYSKYLGRGNCNPLLNLVEIV